ncbi:MAG: AAA family ATPase, partial [Prevotella sp.]|nr:AAA family ATPase [Prevotella sp.]
MEQQKPKRIPYGMQNWEDLRLDNCYYVDKTRFIAEIEAANRFFFFIRPRRFGKSLLMNMLRQYYDVRKASLFERLFGDLWIGQHPTEAHNTYLVLYLNFAAFSGGLEDYKERMDGYCRIQFEGFVEDYADLLPSNALDILRGEEGAANQLSALARICNKAGRQMYLFIDEYDHFTNSVLSNPGTEHGYKAETHGTGAFRAFFDAIKAGTDGSIKRLFVTGVSPVTMDDLTSGFNIGTNYTMHPKFNAMVGFTEEEVREMLDYYRQHFPFRHTTNELLDIMRPWYDNYCFSEECLDEPPMYNSDMVLYFVDKYKDAEGCLPDNMLD